METSISDIILNRNPNVIICKLEENFYAAVNPFVKNGIKIINSNQYKIYNEIDGKKSLEQLAKNTGFTQEDIFMVFKILKEKNYINSTGLFMEPKWNKNVKSLTFWVHTTNDCSLRCSYCYIHTLGLNGYLNEQHIKVLCDKLVETAKKKKLGSITLRLAGGEPLLKFRLWKPYLLEYKKRLQDISCKLHITFLSNLVTLDEEIINFIKENSFGIGVSLDGIGDFHNKTRHFENGKGSFALVERNIRQLKENGITPGIMTVVSNANLKGMEDLTQFIIDNNLYARYSFGQGDKCEKMNEKKLIHTLQLCYNKYENAIERGFLFSQLHKLCDLHLDNPYFQTCSNGFSGGAIYIDGNIYFCQRHFGKETPNGSIFEKDDMLSIVRRKTFYNDVSTECKECNLRYLCTSGCPVERENGKSIYCEVFKEIIPVILLLKGKERLHELKIKYNTQKGGENDE